MVIGIDIGGTKTRVGIAKSQLRIDANLEFATPRDYQAMLHSTTQSINRLTSGATAGCVAIASPGPLNTDAGIILSPRNLAWHNVAIATDLTRMLGCPVILGHDATLGGIAEAHFGAGKPYDSVLYVTISTGLGTSLIIRGQPILAQYNLEGGRQLLKQDNGGYISFEELASGTAIRQKYGKIAADIHDPSIWDDIAANIAWGLFNLIMMTNCEVVVLAGGVVVHHKRFMEPLRHHLSLLPAIYPLPKVVPAKFIETAPLMGALFVAKNSYDTAHA